jgi:hypothetical protein
VNVGHYISLIDHSERALAKAFREVGTKHRDEPDVMVMCNHLASQCEGHVTALQPFVERYKQSTSEDEPDRLHSDLFGGARSGSLALLRDFHDLYLMATEAEICWTVIAQAAQALRDRELLAVVHTSEAQTSIHVDWLKTRIKQTAPQTLVAAR